MEFNEKNKQYEEIKRIKKTEKVPEIKTEKVKEINKGSLQKDKEKGKINKEKNNDEKYKLSQINEPFQNITKENFQLYESNKQKEKVVEKNQYENNNQQTSNKSVKNNFANNEILIKKNNDLHPTGKEGMKTENNIIENLNRKPQDFNSGLTL